ncbi:GNAT family N-acetyltransferase [Sphingomonas solaris]|uniref:N-acetyltransferase n=1 Tax=Alterirhizorhabdus solaris TaxID=2529389 RepID=A0A558QWX4_9SPHN|nr:GNAT family N-acetyltransferase [Sphingomonas solaris]TVV71666.1 N-acetyltransferase [Sphingomonas solaris]
MNAVRDDPAAGRFVLDMDGTTAFAAYQRDGDRLIFTHTEVPEALSGQGIGGRLVQGALDLARAAGGRVVPQCSFVRHFIETHPEYAGMVDG